MFSKTGNKQTGQALVEFGLTLPILLLLILGIIDFGRILFTYSQITNSHRRALRQAEILGDGGSAAPFLDCDHIEDIVEEVFWTSLDIHIRYVKSTTATTNPTYTYDCDSATAEPMPGINNLSNGDLLEIVVTAQVDFLFLPFSDLNLNFEGQRTIIKTLPIGDLDGNDSDYDGLDDDWECAHFYAGTCPSPDDAIDAMLALENATNNPDGDDCNNGCEEGRGSDPNRASPRRSTNLIAIAVCETGEVSFSWEWGTTGVVMPDRGEIYSSTDGNLEATVYYPDTTCNNCLTIPAGAGSETEEYFYMISYTDYVGPPASSEPSRSSNIASASTFPDACSPTTADISGRLWVDTDNDGFVDGDETLAIAGEIVTIDNTPCGGTYATSVTTDSFGFYTFVDLPPCAYQITAPATLTSPYATPSKYNRNGTPQDWASNTIALSVSAGNNVPLDLGYR